MVFGIVSGFFFEVVFVLFVFFFLFVVVLLFFVVVLVFVVILLRIWWRRVGKVVILLEWRRLRVCD